MAGAEYISKKAYMDNTNISQKDMEFWKIVERIVRLIDDIYDCEQISSAIDRVLDNKAKWLVAERYAVAPDKFSWFLVYKSLFLEVQRSANMVMSRYSR